MRTPPKSSATDEASSALSPRQERSRALLLDAAVELFVAYGFRQTSMERIAAEAGVSKATAYARFADKTEIFGAVITHMAEQMIGRAEQAAREAKSPEAAVLASLRSKQTEKFLLVHRSRHAAELLDAFTRVGGAATESAHAMYVASLTKWVAQCRGVGTKLAAQLAALLDDASEGLSARAANEGELGERLQLLVERVIGRK
jgi:AcrR family transcriptional regulator